MRSAPAPPLVTSLLFFLCLLALFLRPFRIFSPPIISPSRFVASRGADGRAVTRIIPIDVPWINTTCVHVTFSRPHLQLNEGIRVAAILAFLRESVRKTSAREHKFLAVDIFGQLGERDRRIVREEKQRDIIAFDDFRGA